MVEFRYLKGSAKDAVLHRVLSEVPFSPKELISVVWGSVIALRKIKASLWRLVTLFVM